MITALQYCVGFCNTSTWISHRYTHVPPKPPSHLPPHPTLYIVTEPQFEVPESYSKFPLTICFTYGSVYVSMLLSPFVPLPPPRLCPQVRFLCLRLHCCPADRLISTILLDSICMSYLRVLKGEAWHQKQKSKNLVHLSCFCCCQVASVVSDSVRPHRGQPTRLPCPWDSPGKNTRVGCHFLLQCMKVKSENEVTQSCPTLRDPMDCSLPGSSIHGIFQARVLEWGAIAFSATFPRYIEIRHRVQWL